MIGYIVVTSIWGVLFFAKEIMHSRERKDLYNRLMSRDLGEYLSADQPRTKLTLKRNYFEESLRKAYRARYGNDKAE